MLPEVSDPAYVFDPNDPRAPTAEQWAALDREGRARVVAQLPSELPREGAPEGDAHRVPKERATQALGEFFRRAGRRVYLSAELPIYYPGERWFAPDLIAVLDVEPTPRDKWVVGDEGKGLDLALEITLHGDRKKDLTDNVERYARLGIPEYFVLDLLRSRIIGFRLDGSTKSYAPIVPQAGRWASRVLGLDLVVETGRVRFYAGSAPLLEADELIAGLSTMVDDLVAKEEALGAALEREQLRASAAEERARAEAQRARAAEMELAALRVEVERLRKS
ncbi:MAG: Uma2 family endonuclease [Polyangiaceae bacterium]|nr:Uma2 family endonuclease [Polyangiaceae bacterium]